MRKRLRQFQLKLKRLIGAGAAVVFKGSGFYLTDYGKGNGKNGNGKSAGSILARKNQIQELRSAMSRLQDEVGEMSRRKGSLQSEQTELQASLQQAQTELRAQEVAIATHQGEFNALQNSLRVLHQKIDTVMYEIQSLAAHKTPKCAFYSKPERAKYHQRKRGHTYD